MKLELQGQKKTCFSFLLIFVIDVSFAYWEPVVEMNSGPDISDSMAGFKEEPSRFAFASYYADHMVLQKAPQRAVVWGYYPYTYRFINISMENQTKRALVDSSGKWSVILDPVEGPGPYTITAKDKEIGEIKLTDVLFGDVWACSGQSNMEFVIRQAFNATQEIKDADNYPHIRVFAMNQTTSTKPLSDVSSSQSIKEQWSVASGKAIGGPAWGTFSAVCWLYGKYLYEKLRYPIGLVNTCWGGTPVEAWSSPDALAKCGLHEENMEPDIVKNRVAENDEYGNLRGPGTPSVLWNSMVNPLLNMTIYGAIWYQGEYNARKPDTYNCTFPAMINDWRIKFYESHGQNNPEFPFGFVMLGANEPNMANFDGFPEIRWHQTADFGFVPNKKMKNVFMADAMDLPDFLSPYGSIHPRDKQDVARRLVNASLVVAYNHTDIISQGPLPTSYTVNTAANTIELVYRNGSESIHIQDNVGFEVCCCYDGEETCNKRSWWLPSSIVRVNRSSLHISTAACEPQYVAGVRYAWRVSPCSFKRCAVYSLLSSLPASPFQFTSPNFSKDGSYVIDPNVPHPLEG